MHFKKCLKVSSYAFSKLFLKKKFGSPVCGFTFRWPRFTLFAVWTRLWLIQRYHFTSSRLPQLLFKNIYYNSARISLHRQCTFT